ncbi:MAG TPA: TylF/MycF/NovP-related O-methyltransferase [Acidimicrobiales bacterium]|nr:TylF/MycF/NovP-related O-methyltransferase [Acidimicrobiales bacterium]
MRSLVPRVKTRLLQSTQKMLGKKGYQIVGGDLMPPDYDEATVALYGKVKPYTLTSHERVFALRQAVAYVVNAKIPGAFVECGVWRGGSMLVIAHTLVEMGATDRDLYLFDTFESMPPPGSLDIDVWGTPAADVYDAALASPVYAYIPQDQIHALLVATGYPAERLHFVKGMVEDTIPEHAPVQIALCRLDTDWYESTAHEMEHLYPRITPSGVLLIDDYGHYMGSRQAVDEYMAKHHLALLLNRIDFTGRLIVVPEHDQGT